VDWKPAETFPELRLNWTVQLPDGTAYGPLNLLAVWALAEESSITPGSMAVERSTGRKALLDSSSLPLLIEEARLMLAGGGDLAAGILETLEAGRQDGDEVLKNRDEQILAWRKRTERLEKDLADSLKLVAETQRYLAMQKEASRKAEEYSHEAMEARDERDAVRKRLAEAEERLQELAQARHGVPEPPSETERRIQAEAQAGYLALQGQLAETEQRLQVVQNERGTLEQQLAEAEQRLQDVVRAERSGVQGQLAAMEQALAAGRNERSVLAEQLAEMGQRLAFVQDERSALEGQLEETQQRLHAEAEAGRSALQERLVETEQRLQAACAAREALQGQLAESAQRLQSVELTLKESQDCRADIQRKLDEVRVELVAGETARTGLADRLKAAEENSRQAGEALRKARERETEQDRLQAAETARLTSDILRLTGELETERATRVSGEQSREAAIAALKAELEQWDGRFQAALVGVRKMEADLQARDKEFTVFRHEAERTEAELTAKVATLRKEADASLRRVQELREMHEQAQCEITQAEVEGAARVEAVREELAAVQRDLSGLLLVSDYVRLAGDHEAAPQTASIDWLDHGRDHGKKGEPRLSPVDQMDLLSRKMRDSAEEHETLRRAMEGLRTSQEAARREAQEKIAQLQQQERTSAGVIQQALEEVEQREAQIRAMRKKAEDRERELLARIEEMEKAAGESMVVEPEVISPGDWARPAAAEREANDARDEKAPDGRNLLNSVEAQLRSELRKWETLNRKQAGAGEQTKKWFARKQS
jgi:chromosome segregation ATPase